MREVAKNYTGAFKETGHLKAKGEPVLISAPLPTVQSCHFEVQLSSLEAEREGGEGEGMKKKRAP